MWNARSLIKQLSSFQSYVYSSDFNVLAVTETWLHDYIFDNEILSSGYNIYRKDRNSRGGGVMLAVSNKLFSKLLPTPDNLELLALSLTLNHNEYIICLHLAQMISIIVMCKIICYPFLT